MPSPGLCCSQATTRRIPPPKMSASRHTFSQLKFIVPGGLVTYWLQTHTTLWEIYTGEADSGGWAR